MEMERINDDNILTCIENQASHRPWYINTWITEIQAKRWAFPFRVRYVLNQLKIQTDWVFKSCQIQEAWTLCNTYCGTWEMNQQTSVWCNIVETIQHSLTDQAGRSVKRIEEGKLPKTSDKYGRTIFNIETNWCDSSFWRLLEDFVSMAKKKQQGSSIVRHCYSGHYFLPSFSIKWKNQKKCCENGTCSWVCWVQEFHGKSWKNTAKSLCRKQPWTNNI